MCPCYKCADRQLKCHSNCESYREYKELLARNYRAIYVAKKGYNDFCDVSFNYYNKRQKKGARSR